MGLRDLLNCGLLRIQSLCVLCRYEIHLLPPSFRQHIFHECPGHKVYSYMARKEEQSLNIALLFGTKHNSLLNFTIVEVPILKRLMLLDVVD